MACLGCYKIFYVLKWFYMYFMDEKMIWMKMIAGLIQITIYLDFLYYYFVSGRVTLDRINFNI